MKNFFFGRIDSMGRFHEHFCTAFSLEKLNAFLTNGKLQMVHRFSKF